MQVGTNPIQAITLLKEPFYSQYKFEKSWVYRVYLECQSMKLIVTSMFIHHITYEGTDQLLKALAIVSWMSPFEGINFNKHSLLWGLTESNLDKTGEFVEGVISEEGLLVLNNQEFTPIFYNDMGQLL